MFVGTRASFTNEGGEGGVKLKWWGEVEVGSLCWLQFYVYLQGTVYMCQNVHSFRNCAVLLFYFVLFLQPWLLLVGTLREWSCTKWLLTFLCVLNVQTVFIFFKAALTLLGFQWRCFYIKTNASQRNEGRLYVIPVSVPMEVLWNESH